VKTEPIVPARIDFAPGAPRAPDFDDLYHPREGAIEQARSVFLAGNGLPERWRGRERFTIFETGFGLGNNFLATWAAWRDDPQRCQRLHFVSLEKHPPTRDDLARALARSPLAAQARALIAAWPPLTPNLHCLAFECGRVQLLLCLGDAGQLARELVARSDAFFLDGFAPARNPAMWSATLFRSLARLAARDATAATWSAARSVRDGLAAAGFEVEAARGQSAKRDITLARYAPRFVPPAPPGRTLPWRAPSQAIVVGAGIAGAAVARALARQGVPCTVLDAQPQAASHASGNPAGLFHGTVGMDDMLHTRWHRAASLAALRWVHEVPGGGAAIGLLRLNTTHDLATMRALIAAQRLPADYVQALDATQASALAGLALVQPAWHFSAGGWADPSALVRAALDVPGVTWQGSARVHAIASDADGWRVLDGDARVIATAPLLVLANAHDALRLAALPAAWIERVRGQVSWLDATQTTLRPRLPIASGGYALALPPDKGGGLLIGATQQRGDGDERVRETDHAENLEKARQLLGRDVASAGALLRGRVGWRVVTRDRLPLAGSVPDLAAPLPARHDAPRLLARRAGLFIHAALGSRGLTTAALGGELIAAQASGAPWPLEADLVDAIDPARWLLRTAR
jgi:tRNA 5-methylaminomethyl-2-thiouridine biosynthesis bifunctional protein